MSLQTTPSHGIIPATVDERKKRLREDRFKDHLGDGLIDPEHDAPSPRSPKRIKGLSTRLEKPYFRLTSSPKASQIRPLSVLKKSLEHIKLKYVESEDYDYCCEQLKSIRQDLTVQNINNRFAAHVYETHGRIALECGDLCEYNQCQSRLQEMKKKGIKISDEEFGLYRLLHALYRGNNLDFVALLKEYANDWGEDHDMLTFTLRLRQSMRTRNDRVFFQLYESSPHMSAYIIDFMLNPMRIRIYETTIRAYEEIPLKFMMSKLGYEEALDCKKFLLSQNAVFSKSQHQSTEGRSILVAKKQKKREIDGKASVQQIVIDCRGSRNNK